MYDLRVRPIGRLLERPRGPTLGEISYALAEITEIKFEIAKSSSLKRNHKLVP